MLELPSGQTTSRRDNMERDSRAWAAFGFAMLVVIGLISAWSLRQVDASDALVKHNNRVITTAQQLFAQVGNAKIAEREYAVTGDDKFLQQHRQDAAAALESFAKVRELTADNATQQQRLNELEPLLRSEFNDLAAMIDLRSKPDEAVKASLAERESTEIDRIHELGEAIEGEEYRLLRERGLQRRKQMEHGLAATIGASLLALLALVLATIQVTRAVKERDKADRAKQESESIAHSLFEAAPQAIVIVDQSATIMMVNPETERLFGYKPEELRGQTLATLIPYELRAEHEILHRRYFESPRYRPMGLNLNLKALRKDGTEFDAEISLGYFNPGQGTLAVAFVSDISQRKADENEIQHQREELRLLAGQLITVQDDERRRIARNLHDDLSQKLAAIAMDAGRLAAKYGSQTIARELQTVQERAAEAAEHVRQISHQLHPSILDDLGLKVALEEYCSEFESRTGIVTQFKSDPLPDRLPAEISDCIYHIAGECLRNVSKHSKSGTAFVSVGMDGKMLRLNVRDKGIGFGQTADRRHGIGIVTMKERARLVGGTVSIQADVEQGTTVSVEVPVNAA